MDILGDEIMIARIFPRKTKYTPNDNLVFIGDPPLFLPDADEIHISITFSWDINEGERLKRSWERFFPGKVKLGGPAYADPGEFFIPGMYVKKGIIFTSRGCPNRCSWCFVPGREGNIRELTIYEGNQIADNNLLACSEKHIQDVFRMLKGQTQVNFVGGLDARLLNKNHVELLNTLRIKRMYFACDYPDAINNIKRIAPLLSHFPTDKKRCYVLIGFDGETITTAKNRLDEVANLGFVPQAMLYRDMECKTIKTDKSWHDLAWSYWGVRSAIRANWNKNKSNLGTGGQRRRG